MSRSGKQKTENRVCEFNIIFMPVYKLKAKRKYGDMPEGYEFQVASASSPTPNASEVEAEIKRLGFNNQAQSYRSSGNFDLTKG